MVAWAHEDLDDALTPDHDQGQRLHVLIPATHADVNLCKTTMGLSILGYPEPVLLGYGKEYNDSAHPVDGGAQLGAKITAALAFLQKIENNTELVMMADGFDSWFQLPPSILRERYFRVMATANYRMRRRLGRRAVRREGLKQTVIFGASKACTPNQISSVACYPIPEAATPRDMYGNNTDTIMGKTKHSSYRPRYLDAGFMMGPAGDVKRILERAQELVETLPTSDSLQNQEPKQRTNLWEGDAQGVFARIFGEQAFQREVIRQRHRSWFKKWSLPRLPGSIEGQHYKDILNPDFTHEEMERMDGHPREYGISVDFSGILVSNTANSESDHRSLVFNDAPQDEWVKNIRDRGIFACGVRLRSKLPEDIAKTEWLPNIGDEDSSMWRVTKLFGNMCLGNIPVVVHHNGDKSLRELAWHDVWWQKEGKNILGKLEGKGAGAYNDQGTWMTWDQLCPAEYNDKLF